MRPPPATGSHLSWSASGACSFRGAHSGAWGTPGPPGAHGHGLGLGRSLSGLFWNGAGAWPVPALVPGTPRGLAGAPTQACALGAWGSGCGSQLVRKPCDRALGAPESAERTTLAFDCLARTARSHGLALKVTRSEVMVNTCFIAAHAQLETRCPGSVEMPHQHPSPQCVPSEPASGSGPALWCWGQGRPAKLWKDTWCPQSYERVLGWGEGRDGSRCWADTAALTDPRAWAEPGVLTAGRPQRRAGGGGGRGHPAQQPPRGGQTLTKVHRHRPQRAACLLSAQSPSLPASWASGREFWKASQSGKTYEVVAPGRPSQRTRRVGLIS